MKRMISMNSEKYVPITEIYKVFLNDDVFTFRKCEPESLEKLIRNKFNFIMNYVVLRPKEKYKINGRLYILKTEQAIVTSLLKEALQETTLIGKWFNFNLNLSSSETTLELYKVINSLLHFALENGEIDSITFDEWVSAVKASIDYSNAEFVFKLKLQLENLRAASAPLNHEVGLGDIYWENEEGGRGYSLKNPEDFLMNIASSSVSNLAEHAYKQKHYYQVLSYIIGYFEKQAEIESREAILYYAKYKKDYEFITDSDDSRISDIADFSIEYAQMHSKMYEYLKFKPGICEGIESELEIKNLLNFFKQEVKS